MKLNLGCCDKLFHGSDWSNVDCCRLTGVDQVVDLNVFPWPWSDESADEIFSSHCFEHLDDPIQAIRECERVLKPGAKVTLIVPHARGIGAHNPCHKWTCFTLFWFRNLIGGYGKGMQTDMRISLVEPHTEMSLDTYWGCLSMPLRLMAQIWDSFWNRTSKRQQAWEQLGLLPPMEIRWTAYKMSSNGSAQ